MAINATSERKAFERESIVEDVWIHGFASLAKTKYVYLAEQGAWCPSVHRRWMEDWRRIAGRARELSVIQVGELVFLYNPENAYVYKKMSEM